MARGKFKSIISSKFECGFLSSYDIIVCIILVGGKNEDKGQ